MIMKMVLLGILATLTLGCLDQEEGVNAFKTDEIKVDNPKNKTISCEDSLLRQIIQKHYTVPSEEDTLGISCTKECLDWFDDMISEETKSYRLGDSIFLCRSRMYGATGLMSNFYHYMLFDGKTMFKFMSLSDNKNLVYLDEMGRIVYIAIDYSKDFLVDKNWEKVELTFSTHVISGSTVHLVSTESKICN